MGCICTTPVRAVAPCRGRGRTDSGSARRVYDAWPVDDAQPEPAAATVRVLVVDDHALVAELLAFRLAQEPDFVVVGTVGSGADASARLRGGEIDVVVVDQHLPDTTGTALMRELHDVGAAWVLVTGSEDRATILDALDAGIVGFVPKARGADEVVDAVRRAARGEVHLSPTILKDVLRLVRPSAPPPGGELTPREREVLGLLVQGRSTAQIARELYLSTNTIRNHVQRVLEKLGVHSQLEAVAYAIRAGLVPPPM